MKSQSIASDPTVSEIVRADYRTADVFKKWGINYCCGGNLPLAEVCRLQGLDAGSIQSELDNARRMRVLPSSVRFEQWPLPFLIDYITHIHHAYIRETGAALASQLSAFVKGHTKKYPYLVRVEECYLNLLTQLIEHTNEEEARIFPYMRQVVSAAAGKESYGKLFIRTLGLRLGPVVEKEHKRISVLLSELRSITDHYRFGDAACTNHQVIYHRLREFDEDLVQHKHLENNILFPRVQELEKELMAL
ncbi:DUF542 domain-containing protein [Flaviaesturariibacter amylovorans]|uniref:Iron-sulfur cluster repair di-iron protein n=1 Tax=Flaviaesturariibacter amylovorans TaxID=1084520 RepID=A0ABP8GYT7_9BACT